MGEMRKTRGTFVLDDQVIIAPNSPWMKSGTIKDNILFGTPSAGGEAGEAASTNPNSESANGKLYDKANACSPLVIDGYIFDLVIQGNLKCRYFPQVIRECGLLEDLQRLPEGDLTWVEPNGENLSGGQKQRISLARVVCLNASVYLLDDPLSAIDPCLKHKIFNQVSA